MSDSINRSASVFRWRASWSGNRTAVRTASLALDFIHPIRFSSSGNPRSKRLGEVVTKVIRVNYCAIYFFTELWHRSCSFFRWYPNRERGPCRNAGEMRGSFPIRHAQGHFSVLLLSERAGASTNVQLNHANPAQIIVDRVNTIHGDGWKRQMSKLSTGQP